MIEQSYLLPPGTLLKLERWTAEKMAYIKQTSRVYDPIPPAAVRAPWA